MTNRTIFSLALTCFLFLTANLQAQHHHVSTVVGGGFLGDGDIGTVHLGLGYGLQLGKWHGYADFALFNGLGAKVAEEVIDDWLINYAYEENFSNRTPYLMYNNGWNGRIGVLYTLNKDAKNSLEIGGGLSLMATNQIDLTGSLNVQDGALGDEIQRVVIPTVGRYLDTGYHFQLRYLHQVTNNMDIGGTFNHQRSFDSYFGVYTFGGLQLRFRL